MRLLFVQFGDYKEAYYRLANGGPETYYAQKFTVNWVAEKSKEIEYLGVLCVVIAEEYNELLPNGVQAIGTNFDDNKIIRLIEKVQPTHLICCYPSRPILNWSIKNEIRTLPLLADSFDATGFRSWFRNYRLKNLLNHNHFEWVANHNINACRSLERIGVDPQKIIAWDFPPMITPDQFSMKTIPEGLKSVSMLYAGNLLETKGVGDCIESILHLKDKGINASLTVVGPGDSSPFLSKSQNLKIDPSVKFLGRVGHDQVIKHMIENDIVLVPSWHEYPEGLPMTIYEGFCSHTPLVVSDHPMFKGKVRHRENGMVFRAKDSKHLSEVILELIENPKLYEKISLNSTSSWHKLQIQVKWDQLLFHWLRNNSEDKAWFKENALGVSSGSIIN